MQFFFPLLAVVFITLKLLAITAVATWSWWWILSPLWLPLAVVLASVSIGGILGMLGVTVLGRRKNHFRRW